MYHIYNTDELTVKIVSKSELYGVLSALEMQGAVFSLDIDDEICYSYEDEFEGETIDVLIAKAPFH